MRVGSVSVNQRNEIVVVNRKLGFQSSLNRPVKNIIKDSGINMETSVGYNGKTHFTPAPISIGEKLANYFHKMEINWDTHVDPTKQRRRFE